MSDRPAAVKVPWKLAVRRARYQIVPVTTMFLSTLLAGWLWVRHASSATGTGEVAAVRVAVESKVEGVLAELPQPVHQFDAVRKGQLVARVDTSLDEAQLSRLRAEAGRIRAASQPADLAVLAEREAQVAELQAKIDARDMKSPIDGTVMDIRRRPGHSARLGKPIMEIAARDAEYIIGYLREDQPIRPTTGMKVTVRPRGGGSGGGQHRSFESYVNSVGAQVEKLPGRHQRNPNVAEYGIPVQIALPQDARVTPGEMVDLVFHPDGD
jgi:multidrug resistance efflux pump